MSFHRERGVFQKEIQTLGAVFVFLAAAAPAAFTCMPVLVPSLVMYLLSLVLLLLQLLLLLLLLLLL